MSENAGRLELCETPAHVAAAFANTEIMKAQSVGLPSFLPSFVPHYTLSQTMAMAGQYMRSEMPVIEEEDLEGIKDMLASTLRATAEEKLIAAKHLVPIQKQIYLDKCVTSMAREGLKGTKDFLKSKHLFISEEGDIIDGHHRWLSAMLVDPDFEFRAFEVCLEERKVLKLALDWTDAHHRERNA